MSITQITADFNACTLAKVFEFQVIRKDTKKSDWVTFDVSISGRTMYGHHESLTAKQAKSKKVAFVKIPLDKDFSLDSHLQELHEACTMAIIDSDFFELAD